MRLLLGHHTVNTVYIWYPHSCEQYYFSFFNRVRNWVMKENTIHPKAQERSCKSASIWCAPCLGNSDPIASRHIYFPTSSTRSQHSWWQTEHLSFPIPLSQNSAAYIDHSKNNCKPPQSWGHHRCRNTIPSRLCQPWWNSGDFWAFFLHEAEI